MRVAAFTGGRDVPSARFRVRQYILALRSYECELTEFPALAGCYPPSRRWARPAWVVATLAARFPQILRSYPYDVIVLQREMLSTYYTLERLTKRPRILDVDDAIWLRRSGRAARRLANDSDGIICGNQVLAEKFGQWNRSICVLPTPVDAARYRPSSEDAKDGEGAIIGWSGTSGGLKHLYRIEPALRAILDRHPGAKLLIVCDLRPKFGSIPDRKVEFVRWSRETEVVSIQRMTAGIMPLEDCEWTRGKCSFKMLTYMACAVPVIVSPVGMNKEVLGLGSCGLGPTGVSDWIEALDWVIENPVTARQMGAEGRRIVENHFSVDVLAPRFASILRHFAS